MEEERILRGLPPSDSKIPLVTTPMDVHPAGQVRYGGVKQLRRTFSLVSYFMACIMMIFLTQLIGAPLYYINKPLYYSWMARTKKHFGVLIITITQWWSPTIVRITGDRSVRHQLKKTADGRLECQFPERMILIANHQLYSDWLYLWWIAYTARCHGFLYIILKESLKYIPLFGWGMRFYSFIFLARKWEQDKPRFAHRLSKLTAGGRNEPMWLMIFPEGTNLAKNGRETSRKFAEKTGQKDLRHCLLPRSTGLRFCLEKMDQSVDWVYDCTMAYEGVPRGKFGQDFFTLKSTYLEGRPPKSVNLHWRRFAISSIPISDPAEFEAWLRQRWQEKDDLLEYYIENGRFPEDDEETTNGNISPKKANGEIKQRAKIGGAERLIKVSGGTTKNGNWAGPVETEVMLGHWWEVTDLFAVIGAAGLLANVAVKACSLAGMLLGEVPNADHLLIPSGGGRRDNARGA